jgi:hypothetical protein
MELILKVVFTNHLEEKIDSSAEALRVRHHPLYLSLRKSILHQHRVRNRAGKTAKNGNKQSIKFQVSGIT